MYHLSLVLRFTVLVLFIALPIASVGAILAGVWGIVFAAGVSLLGVVYMALSTENLIAKIHRAGSEIPKGLERSLELVLSQQKNKQAPRVLIFGDPSPNALIVKSWFGSGTILISQGMIALLNEEELRAILKLCLQRLWERGSSFQSLCALLALFTLSFAPHSWIHLFFAGRALRKEEEVLLSPLSGMRFFALYPATRLFVYLGKTSKSGRRQVSLSGPDFVAVQKVIQAIQIWGPGRFHGSFGLYFIHPVTGEILLPHH
jgi:hypothetical protein